MTLKTLLQCDVPGCYRNRSSSNLTSMVTKGVIRGAAKESDWNTTSVPNPWFKEGETWYEPKKITLDRCPDHRRVKLAVEIIDEKTYRIVER